MTGVVPNCGVYQYGKRLFDILKLTAGFEWSWHEVNSLPQYCHIVQENPSCQIVFHNYHQVIMPWLTTATLSKQKLNIGIDHDRQEIVKFDVLFLQAPHLPDDSSAHVYSLPRPLLEKESKKETKEQNTESVPVIGSFGLGYGLKGFEHVIDRVNKEFDDAVIRFHMPVAHYAGANEAPTYMAKLQRIPRKPGIKLIITTHFMTEDELLEWLNGNSINMFLYAPNRHSKPGLCASVLDYALAVNKPLLVSRCSMFQHLLSQQCGDKICIDRTSIKEALTLGTQHLAEIRTLWSPENLRAKVEQVIFKYIKH